MERMQAKLDVKHTKINADFEAEAVVNFLSSESSDNEVELVDHEYVDQHVKTGNCSPEICDFHYESSESLSDGTVWIIIDSYMQGNLCEFHRLDNFSAFVFNEMEHLKYDSCVCC
jgi:hypothetical protein